MSSGFAVRAAIFGQGAVAVATLATSTVLARLAGPTDFGQYIYLLTLTSVLAIVLDTNYSAVIVSRPTFDPDLGARLARVNLLVASVPSFLILLAIVAFPGNPAHHAWALAALLTCLPLQVMSTPGRVAAVLQRRLLRSACLDVVAVLTSAGLAILLMRTLDGQDVFALASFSLGVALLRLGLSRVFLGSPFVRLAWGLRPRITRIEWSETWGFYVYHVSQYLGRNLDNVVVGGLLGDRSLGYYSRSFSYSCGPANVLQSALTFVAIDGSVNARALATVRLYVLPICLMGPALVFAVLQPSEVISFLLGSAWARSAEILVPLGCLALITLMVSGARWEVQRCRQAGLLRGLGVLQLLPVLGLLIGALVTRDVRESAYFMLGAAAALALVESLAADWVSVARRRIRLALAASGCMVFCDILITVCVTVIVPPDHGLARLGLSLLLSSISSVSIYWSVKYVCVDITKGAAACGLS